MRLAAVVVVVLLAGCFDAAVVGDVAIACSGQADCPAGFRCVDVLERCVRIGDDEAPPQVSSAVIEPAALGPTTRGILSFVIDEALALAPAVFANGTAVVVVDDGDGAFHVDLDGSVLPEGFVRFDAELVDLGGNVAQVALPSVVVDRTPPQVVDVAVPARVRGNAAFFVVALASEGLSDAAVVVGGAGIVQLPGAVVVDGATATLGVEVEVPAGGGDVVVELLELRLVDVVGNVVVVPLTQQTVLDRTRPAVVDVDVVSPRLSFVAGFDQLRVDFAVEAGAGDSVTDVAADVAGQALVCTPAGVGSFSCALGLDGLLEPIAAGVRPVSVAAFDEVGNTGFGGGALTIDDQPPVVTGRVRVTGRSGVERADLNAGVGARIVVDELVTSDAGPAIAGLPVLVNGADVLPLVNGWRRRESRDRHRGAHDRRQHRRRRRRRPRWPAADRAARRRPALARRAHRHRWRRAGSLPRSLGPGDRTMKAVVVAVVVVFFVVAAGCFDAAVVGDVTISCSGQADCAPGFRCIDVIERCVAIGDDEEPPGLSSASAVPEALGPTTAGTLSFVVDEALALSPAVFANGAPIGVVDDGGDTFHVALDGAALPEGFVVFEAVLVDVGGNAARVPLPGVRVDRTPPVLVELTAPARVRGEQPFVVVALASEDLSSAAIVVGGDGVTQLARDVVVNGIAATLEVAVDVELAIPPGAGVSVDTVIELQQLRLVDLVGNEIVVPLDRNTVIDRTKPGVAVDVLTPRVSFVPGFNTMQLAVSADAGAGDALADLIAEVDGVTLGCTSDGDARFTCLALLDVFPAALAPGVHPLSVAAFDVVGNGAFAGGSIGVDDAAPTVTGGVRVIGRTGVARADLIVGLGGSIVVDIDVVDEGAASPPVLTLFDGVHEPIPFVGNAVVVDGELPEGVWQVQVDVVDDVGNARTVILVEEIVVDDVVPSPCVMLDDDDVPLCTDFDGDGAPGVSSSCPFAFGSDCDDSDPLVAPNLVDVPGDGIDNDCGGDGDVVVDEGEFLFVTATAAANGRGSRSSPMDLRSALLAAIGSGKAIIVAAGVYDVDTGLVSPCSIFGGYDALSWLPGGGDTVFSRATFGGSLLVRTGTGPVGVFGVVFRSDSFSIVLSAEPRADAIVLGDLRFEGAPCTATDGCGTVISAPSDRVMIARVDIDVTNTNVGLDLTQARVVDVRIAGPTFGVVGGALNVHHARIEATAVAVGGTDRVVIAESILSVDGDTGAVVLVADDATIAHSSLRATGSIDQNFVAGVEAELGLVLVNNVISVVESAISADEYRASGNAIGGTCAVGTLTDCFDVDELNACTAPGCVVAAGNVAIIAADVDAAGALLIPAPGVDLRPLASPALGVLAGDRAGRCRVVTTPQIGP
ncbi:MAG: putative metal-binding motif-containing protein [Deltaproteobacteria bacterium]|nr:putative metal-binding motif-containing protein [Deltaproteobacteria bacterium]